MLDCISVMRRIRIRSGKDLAVYIGVIILYFILDAVICKFFPNISERTAHTASMIICVIIVLIALFMID